MLFKRVVLAAGALAALGAVDHVDRHFPARQGEFYLLLMFSLPGMTLLPGARDLILLVVCLRADGPAAVRPGQLREGRRPDEGAQVRGRGRHQALPGRRCVSTAITLFGLSFVYGMAETTSHRPASPTAPMTPLLAMGMMLALAGMGFKMGAVPFHIWVPDTYQGAPTPFVAFLSVAPQGDGLRGAGGGGAGGLHGYAAQLAAVLLALRWSHPGGQPDRAAPDGRQAHAGVLGRRADRLHADGLSPAPRGASMLLFYSWPTWSRTWAPSWWSTPSRPRLATDRWRPDGLWKRSPWLGLAMLLFVLSLAGIPFVVGFWAKLYVFIVAWQSGLYLLVILGRCDGGGRALLLPAGRSLDVHAAA